MTFSAVNTIWVLLGAALVFFMQAGFAMCEAGFTRAKNTGNILMKNLMDFLKQGRNIIGLGVMPGEEYLKKLLSPCVRETSNEVAERVSLTPFRGLEPALARG
mgnify:CR=1 FL=1